MVELFSGRIQVQYGQAYIELIGPFDGDMGGCFRGQRNGLCGARVPAILFLVSGLHTGVVGVDIRLFEAEPALDEGWEEIVEVSRRRGGEIRLVEWAADEGVRIPLAAGSYRVRYQARGMDAGNALNTNDTDTPVDGYRLDLWAAPPAADRVVRQTADIAAYWHDWARQLSVLIGAAVVCVDLRAATRRRWHEWGGRLGVARGGRAAGSAAAFCTTSRHIASSAPSAWPRRSTGPAAPIVFARAHEWARSGRGAPARAGIGRATCAPGV